MRGDGRPNRLQRSKSCVVADAVIVEPVSPCTLEKCRVILPKCRAAVQQTFRTALGMSAKYKRTVRSASFDVHFTPGTDIGGPRETDAQGQQRTGQVRRKRKASGLPEAKFR